jgi:hypothetical protein
VSRTQFILLNLVGGLCALLIVGDLVLGLLNGRLNQSVAANQSQFGQAQQVQNTAKNLVMRIAQSASGEPALRELLARHDFPLLTNTPAKASP